MPFGTTEGARLLADVLVVELSIAAGSLVVPRDVGTRVVAGIRDRITGVARHERPPAEPEGSPYDLLV